MKKIVKINYNEWMRNPIIPPLIEKINEVIDKINLEEPSKPEPKIVAEVYTPEVTIQKPEMKVPVWEEGVRQGGKLNEKVMTKNLIDFKKVMDKYDIPFVFIFGGCLGLMRDFGKPWAHPEDTDTDVMCYEPDHRKMGPVVKELREMGFSVPDRNDCPLRDHFIIRGGEKIEIWWFEEIDNMYYYSPRVWYKKEHFQHVEMVKFAGKVWRVPSRPEKFVEITYGKNWQVPRPEASYILKTKKEI